MSAPAATSRSNTTWAVTAACVSALLYLLLHAIHVRLLEAGLSGYVDAAALVGNVSAYSFVIIGLYLAYSILLVKLHGEIAPRAVLFLTAFAVSISLAWWWQRPYFSDDVFSYLMHGYIGALPGGNPYVEHRRDLADSVFGRTLIAYGWTPVVGVSPYGPLWTQIEVATLRLTQDVWTGMLVLKTVVTLASLANAALIYDIAKRIWPASALTVALAYLWNPLIMTQFASEGHNDALMITFILAAIALTIRGGEALGVVSMLLGALTKFLPILLVPPLAVYQWRRAGRRAVGGFLMGVAIAAAIGALLYWPFWSGRDTFRGVLDIRWEPLPFSHAGMLRNMLNRWLPVVTSSMLTTLITGSALLVAVAVSCVRLRTASDLVRACAVIAVVYMLCASPIHFPWYAAFPVTLLTLCHHPLAYVLAILLSLGGQITIPSGSLFVANIVPADWVFWGGALVSLTLPVLMWFLVVALGRAGWLRQFGGIAAEPRS